MEQKILIVEDEKDLAKILGDYLRLEGFQVDTAYDGEEGLSKFENGQPDLLLLDIMLPKTDGIEVCKKVRTVSKIPIIMLSAKGGEMDKVVSLGAGADDYVTKPFSPMELVARVKAQMRRYQVFSGKEADTQSQVRAGRLLLSKKSYEASVDGVALELTTKEFEMLLFFAVHQNQVFSKEQIYGQVWGHNEFGDISSVAVYIRRIRNKLEKHHADYIKTIWGAGYKLAVEESR